MAFDEAVQRLVALGRQRGRLTTDDLRRLLPIEAMTANDIADVVVRLEDAGVAVDVDEALLAGRPGVRPAAPGGLDDTWTPQPPGPSSGGGAVAPAPPRAPRSTPPAPAKSRGFPVYWAAVALAVLFVILLFGFGLPGYR